MNDALVIVIVLGFFALCAAYVIWCERMLAADAPDRLAHRGADDLTFVGRAASTAGAADTESALASVASGSEAGDDRRLRR